MSHYLNKEIKSKIDRLAYYQIAGGIIGLGMVIWLLAKTSTITGLLLLLILFATALYSFSIYCGNNLRKNKDPKPLLKLSLVNQLIQTVSLAIPGFIYKFDAGLSLSITFDFTEKFNILFNFSLSSFQFNLGTDDNFIKVGFNIAAFAVIFYIINLQEEIRESEILIAENLSSEA